MGTLRSIWVRGKRSITIVKIQQRCVMLRTHNFWRLFYAWFNLVVTRLWGHPAGCLENHKPYTCKVYPICWHCTASVSLIIFESLRGDSCALPHDLSINCTASDFISAHITVSAWVLSRIENEHIKHQRQVTMQKHMGRVARLQGLIREEAKPVSLDAAQGDCMTRTDSRSMTKVIPKLIQVSTIDAIFSETKSTHPNPQWRRLMRCFHEPRMPNMNQAPTFPGFHDSEMSQDTTSPGS